MDFFFLNLYFKWKASYNRKWMNLSKDPRSLIKAPTTLSLSHTQSHPLTPPSSFCLMRVQREREREKACHRILSLLHKCLEFALQGFAVVPGFLLIPFPRQSVDFCPVLPQESRLLQPTFQPCIKTPFFVEIPLISLVASFSSVLVTASFFFLLLSFFFNLKKFSSRVYFTSSYSLFLCYKTIMLHRRQHDTQPQAPANVTW